MITTIGGVQYREVKREAEVGDFILYREAPGPYLTEGKPYKVVEIDSANDPQIVDDEGNEYDTCGDDFVVLEKSTDSAEVAEMVDTITHNGKQYRKVDRPVRERDAFIVPKMEGYDVDLTSGKVYAIKQDTNGLYFIDDVGDRRTRPIIKNDVYVLEPVAPSLSALETELAATKAKVAEMEAQLAEAKRQREAREIEAKWAAIGRAVGEFKSGDIAKITRYQYGLPEGTVFAVTGIKREGTVGTPGGYGADVTCIELVAPVESVVNLRGGDAV